MMWTFLIKECFNQSFRVPIFSSFHIFSSLIMKNEQETKKGESPSDLEEAFSLNCKKVHKVLTQVENRQIRLSSNVRNVQQKWKTIYAKFEKVTYIWKANALIIKL